MKYLLDTCVLSELIKPEPSARVVEWITAQDELRLYCSVITLGEIHKGIHRLPDSRKRTLLHQWVETDLLRRFAGRWLDVTLDVAERWGRMAAERERVGSPLPVLDGLIAAIALTNGMTVVTRDEKHVAATGVEVFNPWSE